MSSDEKTESGPTEQERREEMLAAPKAVESDAESKIEVSTSPEGHTRIDWRDDAPVRPGAAPRE